MDGTYEFDHVGRATVIDAPAWSEHALRQVQEGLLDAAEALANERLSNRRAFAVLDSKLDLLIDVTQGQGRTMQQIADNVRQIKKKVSRPKLVTVLLAFAFILGTTADASTVIPITTDYVMEVADKIESGNVSVGRSIIRDRHPDRDIP